MPQYLAKRLSDEKTENASTRDRIASLKRQLARKQWRMSVTPSNVAARQERIDQLRRNRAAAVPLRVAFPAVQHLRIELRFESSSTKAPTPQSHVLHPPAQAFFDFPCPYAECDGHFDLTGAVNVSLADPAHHGAGVLECSGLRPRDWASKRPCQLHLIYKVTATYRRDT